MRTFIAVTLPERVKHDVSHVLDALKKERMNIKWVAPENIHLTLKFLGDVKKEMISDIQSAMEDAVKNAENLSVSAKGLGAFPGFSRPKVIWAGLSGGSNEISDIIKIRDNLELCFEELGFKKDSRPFKAHLTIGRVKGGLPSKQLMEAVSNHLDFESKPFTVDRIALIKSDLLPNGPVYTKIYEACFP